MAFILDPQKLREAVHKLIKEHGSFGALKARIDPEVNEEYDRHREFLSKSVQQLKTALTEDMVHHSGSTSKMLKTNLELIDEINKQRESNKKLKEIVQASTGRLTHLARVAAEKMVQELKKQREETIGGAYQLPNPPSTAEMPSRNKKNKSKDMMIKTSNLDINTNNLVRPITSQESESANEYNPLFLLEKNRRRINAMRQVINELESKVVPNQNPLANLLPPLENRYGLNANSISGFNDSIDIMSPS